MIGILTEKPSAARNFAKALGGMEGTYNGEQYRITAARGHLFELLDPAEQVDPAIKKQYKSWKTQHLPWHESDFTWTKRKNDDAEDVLRQIRKDLNPCEEIIIATDDDPSGEGELLAWEIITGLKLKPQTISRMYFVDESPKSIRSAFETRKILPSMEEDLDYVKADFRSKWDFLSMQFTRIATANADGRSVLRQGRLKSAMVLMVGDQLKKVNAYKKVPFYEKRFKDENGNVFINTKEEKFDAAEKVNVAIESSPVIVDSVTKKTTAPPKLLDLSGLSAMLSSRGLKARTVLSTYQKMYEDQIVSYPRTEDKTITPEQFNELAPLVDQIAELVGVDTSLLTHRKPRNKTHVAASGAHGANRPGPRVPESLESLKKYGAGASAIYTTLAKNFLAMFAENYQYEQQKGHLEKYPEFKATTDIPKFRGWKAVYSTDKDDEEEGNVKKLGKMADPFVYEGFPPKPQTPTMRWLMRQLAKYDVGTGATRTSIYAEVTNANSRFPLLAETRGKLSMTDFGEMSYQLLPGTNIGNLKMTERLQQQMKAIGEGHGDPIEFLNQMESLVREDLATMEKNGKKIVPKTYEKNPADYATGTWQGREVEFKKEFSGYTFTDEEIAKLLADEPIEIHFVNRMGQEAFARGKLEEQVYKKRKFIGFKPSEYLNADGTPIVDEVEYFEGEWNGRQVKAKRVFGNHRFTDEEVAKLLAGESIKTDFVSKKGKPFKATGKLADQFFRGHKFFGFKIEEFEKKPRAKKTKDEPEAEAEKAEPQS